MTTIQGWRDLLEVACIRQNLAFDLAEECVELHGPTAPISALAYAIWQEACEQHEAAEREYLDWLRAGRKVVT